jgi:hypothetical protein
MFIRIYKPTIDIISATRDDDKFELTDFTAQEITSGVYPDYQIN